MTLLRAPRAPWTLLTLLLVVDAIFMALHYISIWGVSIWGVGGVPAPDWLNSARFRVDVDWGYGEGFGYLKLLLVIGLLFHLRRRYGLSAVVWSLVFSYVLLDDAFTVHEHDGALLTGRLMLTPSYGLRAQDVGELLVWGGVGIVLGGLVVVAYLRASEAERRFSAGLCLLFAVLVFFGASVDMAHSALFGSLLAHALGSNGPPLQETVLNPSLFAPSTLGLIGSVVPLGVVLAALYALLLSQGSTVVHLQGLNVALTLLEDGGELIALSAVLSYCGYAARATRPAAVRRFS